jgi:hypothetical protein
VKILSASGICRTCNGYDLTRRWISRRTDSFGILKKDSKLFVFCRNDGIINLRIVKTNS